MDTADILNSLRILLRRGEVEIFYPGAVPSTKDWLFFDEIPQELTRSRYLEAKTGIRNTWYLVSDQSFGREWTDDMLGAGVLIAEVDELELSILRREFYLRNNNSNNNKPSPPPTP